MKKQFFFLLCAVLVSMSLYAQTNISANISSNTTLTVANSPYVVTNSIEVNPGITLTVQSGVEIRFNAGVYLHVRGTLSATGAKFTANGSTNKGFWDGIYVSYEYYETGNVTLDNCNVEYASNIYIRKGQLTLKNSTLNNFSGYGVQISSLGTLNIDNTTIKNTNFPVYFYGPGQMTVGSNVLLTGNANDYVYLNFSDITGEFRLRKLNIPYYNPYKRVTETGTLIIEPGVQIKSVNSEITVSGKIKAVGTKSNPIIFDMSSNASYWLGINITASAIDTACIFKNCSFRNAVYDHEPYCALEINAASPTIDSCKFTGNSHNLVITGISKPKFTNCTFGPSITQGSECYNIAMDLNAQPVFTSDSIQFNSKEIRAIKILEGNIIDDSRLSKTSFIGLPNITYCLYGNANVVDTASLTIDAGIVIKCRYYYSILYGNGVINGVGTAVDPIIFTHIADDNFGNPLDSQNDGVQGISHSNSGRIVLYSKATSRIENWKIYYGGYNPDNYAVYATEGNIVKGCEIKNSYRGVYFAGNAQVVNNAFMNIDYYPVARLVNKGSPVLLGNTVSNVGIIGILINGFADDSPTLKSMDFAGFTNVAYIIENQQTINTGNMITVDPGVVVKFTSGGRLLVNGAWKAIGKASNKIILTSINDDSAAGDTNNNGTGSSPGNADWSGIDFTPTASDVDNYLKNCEVRYVSYYYWTDARAAVRINSCKVVMDSTKVNFTNTCAVAIMGDANPTISNCQFYNLGDAPVYMDLFASPVFSGDNKLANLPFIAIRLHGKEVKGTVPVRNFAGYTGITYILEEDMTIMEQLTIPAGVTFKGAGRWLVRGRLDVQGTTLNPVVFTTLEDDGYGNPKDTQQNGNSTLNNNGNYIIFYDEANDLSTINHALFRYPYRIPIQLTNASPKVKNSTFENAIYEGVSLFGSSKPGIDSCTFNNIPFPFTTSLVTYPASTAGNVISGTTGRGIRVTNETLTNDVVLGKKSLAGITNIPYIFQNYTVGTGAKLTISPGVICKFMSGGYINVYNGLVAKGGTTTDSTVVFTSDRDDFYGGDTYNDGDANLPSLNYWNGIYFFNESLDESCTLENCIIKNGSYVYYLNYYPTYNRGAITVDNASPTIKNCLFKDNFYGIMSFNTSLPKISNCDFVGTEATYGYGVWNVTPTNTVTAENCWWNSNTGPKHSSNPGGLGEKVSDNVDFTPFAVQLAKPVLGDISLNGSISPYDASLVLQHTVSAIVLNAAQKGVADVSGNGTITSYDASLILQYCVGLISRFVPGTTKAGVTGDLASASFSNAITYGKNTLIVPVMLSTQSTVKSLELKYEYNNRHLRFLKMNTSQLPSGISFASGSIASEGSIAFSLASAYDLNLNNLQVELEFELLDPAVDQSTLSLVSGLANESEINELPASVSFATADIALGIDANRAGSYPEIYYANQKVFAKFVTEKPGQTIEIQLADQAGKIVFRRTLKGLGSGYHSYEFPFAGTGKAAQGVYIMTLRAADSNYATKLLIK